MFGLHPRCTESKSLGLGPENIHLTSILGDSDVDQLLRIATSENLSLPVLVPVRERYTGHSGPQLLSCCVVAYMLWVLPGLGISWEVREKEILFMGWFLVRASTLPSNTFPFIL